MKPGGKELSGSTRRRPARWSFCRIRSRAITASLKAERMIINYGAKNEIQSFHAAGVSTTTASTETYPSEEERRKKKGNLATAFTSSKTIDATFDDKGQLKQMKQTDNFRYTEGDRKAQADSATLQNDTNVMDLEKNARISDASGSTSGDHIQLDQKTGDFDARGHVSTRACPKKRRANRPCSIKTSRRWGRRTG